MVQRLLWISLFLVVGCASKRSTEEVSVSAHRVHAAHEFKALRAKKSKRVTHGGHEDFVHGTHLHHLHDGHFDEHGGDASVGSHSVHLKSHPHQHGSNCGHKRSKHADHSDYFHDGHYHTAHGDHFDEHGVGPHQKRKAASR